MTLAIAMIETREALDALDEILATPGIDGVFVGPSDLSIALNRGAVVDPHGADVEAALSRIVERAHAHGKFAGLFCFDGARAKAALARGFALVLRVDRLDPAARGGAPRTRRGALTACDIISQAPRPPRRPHSRGQSAPVGGFPRRAPPARRRLRANRNKISPRSIGRRLHAIDPADGALIALERADWVGDGGESAAIKGELSFKDASATATLDRQPDGRRRLFVDGDSVERDAADRRRRPCGVAERFWSIDRSVGRGCIGSPSTAARRAPARKTAWRFRSPG